MSDQTPAPRNGSLMGLVDRLLTFMSVPWKAVVVVVLLIVCGVGWLVWDKRDVLFAAWLAPATTDQQLNVDAVPLVLAQLVEQTHADVVQIWAVDLPSNSQTFLGARRYDGQPPDVPSPRRLPVMDHTSDVRRLTEILDGHSLCVDLKPDGTPMTRRLAERGLTRGCAIPVTPSQEALAAVVYLAWKVGTDASEENVVVGSAREIAKSLAK